MDGIVNAVSGIFRIYASGKTFVATYKQGKKSWESGEGWGKTFIMIGASIFAIINLGQMAAKGSEMIAANQAKDAVSGSSANTSKAITNGVKGKNPFDLNGDGKLSQGELMKMMKENKIPGMDLKDPRYTGVNGYQNFLRDLNHNSDFRKIIPDGIDNKPFRTALQLNLMNSVKQSSGVTSFRGESFFQRFIGADPSAAENAAKRFAQATGNNV